jgi:hypothetical protein
VDIFFNVPSEEPCLCPLSNSFNHGAYGSFRAQILCIQEPEGGYSNKSHPNETLIARGGIFSGSNGEKCAGTSNKQRFSSAL